jgi:ribosome biogenesis GTPase / thiamine phosphate phosphatase
MSKPTLSKKQRRDQVRRQQADVSDTAQRGLLIAHYGSRAEVEDTQKQRFLCQLRQNLGNLVCGDQLHFQPLAANTGLVVERLPRRNVLLRPDAQGKTKPIAANIDQVIVVLAPQPTINPVLLDSYLVLAESLGIDALIVLNKIDLLSAAERVDCQRFLATYQDLGYAIHTVSVKQQLNLAALTQALAQRVQVVVGQSGVGKSSLINALIPDHDIRVGPLTKTSNKGRHTTTTARYYHGPYGDLIDSPGIRELKLGQMNMQHIAQGFREFQSVVDQCRFRDCKHTQDRDCAIVAALQAGTISAQRYDSFRKICEKL